MKQKILIPIKGTVKHISETPDQVFSNLFLGEGLVVFPDEGTVVAPFDGTIKSVFPTKHALTLTSNKGLDVLIHIGLETVKLEGKGFEVFVEENQKVKQGELLVKFDLDYIKEHADSPATPIVFVEKATLTTKNEIEKKQGTFITVITE